MNTEENKEISKKISMLHIINLYVIDKIFEEAIEKVGAYAKMLYINCLTHHFKNKPAKITSIIAFELFHSDIANYIKYQHLFIELHKADLVSITEISIKFNNVWSKHIDLSKLDKVNPDEYVAGFQFESISRFKEDLLNNTNLIELSMMKNKLSKEQSKKLIELFILEQETYDKKYSSLSDCIKHCSYYLSMNSAKVPKDVVKSSGKILGK